MKSPVGNFPMETAPRLTPSSIWTAERIFLAKEALQLWHGTPHRNRIAVCGLGVDCIKFLHAVFVHAGIIEAREFTGYSVDDGMHEPSTRLRRIFEHVLFVSEVPPFVQKEFGDIVIFKTGERSAHCAFFDDFEDGRLWHAPAGKRVTFSDWKLWKNEIEVALRLTALGWRNDPQTAVKI